MMETGISIGALYREQTAALKRAGVNRTFISSEHAELEAAMSLFEKEGIICETLHAPFDGINDMWKEGEAGDIMLSRLVDSVDKCARYGVPVSIIHVSSGRPMQEITDIGTDRYARLVDYAEKRGVTLAFENLRYFENLKYLFDKFPGQGFCWDVGHEHCYTPGTQFMKHFGDKLAALHIHDNSCETDCDDHILPFDGKIDFDYVAASIAKSGYSGTLMLEIGKNSVYYGEKIYEALSMDEFYFKAAEAARKLAGMVEAYRRDREL